MSKHNLPIRLAGWPIGRFVDNSVSWREHRNAAVDPHDT
jgi:hypothetical protein